MPDLTLHTPRLVLEPLVRVHAALLYPGLRDPALYTFIPKEPPASVETLAARFERLERRASPDGSERWLNWAARRADAPAVGASGAGTSGADASAAGATAPDASAYVGQLEATVSPDGTASIAYFVFASAQRTGYGAEGALAVVSFLFGEGVSAVLAYLDTRNVASMKLVEKIGFRRDRIIEKADYFKGSSSDEYVYRLTSPAGGWRFGATATPTRRRP